MSTNKELNCKWNFVEMSPQVVSSSGENPIFEKFSSNSYRYVVREYIQNSIDAACDKSYKTPVVVKIKYGTIETSEYESLLGEDLLSHIRACRVACENNSNGVNAFVNHEHFMESIQNSKCYYLEISDEETTGMDYKGVDEICGWNAGVRTIGASIKDYTGAGGSHGYGKTAGFVVSNCNAVYFSTMTPDNLTYGEGVVLLCDHKLNDKKYHANAFYDSEEGYQPDNENIPDVFKRRKPGTSVFVLGVSREEEDIVTMKEAVLRNFWMAIHEEKLVVEIEGEEFNHGNLIPKMEEYFHGDEYGDFDVKRRDNQELLEEFNPKPYYQKCILGQGTNDGIFKIFTSNREEYPNLGSVKMYVYVDENIKSYTDDRIVCMRDMGMVIEMRRIFARKGFYGVLVCSGNGGDLLRKIENVTHEKWDWRPVVKKLPPEDLVKAKAILREMDRFIADVRKQLFPESDDQQYNVPVLSKYLLSSGNKSTSDKGKETEESSAGIQNPQMPNSTKAEGYTIRRVEGKNLGRVVIRRRGGAKKRKEKKPVEEGLQMGTQPAPPVRETEQGKKPINDPPTPNHDPVDNPKYPGGENSKPTPKQDKREGYHEPTTTGSHTNKVVAQFRVVPLIEDNGLVHRIIINADQNYSSCSMVVNIAGEDSDTVLSFVPLNQQYKVGGKDMNTLSNFSLVKGKNYIDIKFSDNDFHSLRLKAYED